MTAKVPLATAPPKTSSGSFRPDIQALRAVAVGLVVLYHLWPTRLTGGYVGVDVFFVISGFLITAHLLSEMSRSGAISLSRFWARRIRRLLPAGLTVLIAALIGALVWIPDTLLQQNLRDIGASSIYIVNWVLASDAVDYLAAESLPSLVQHYWSLAVEEQFYILWPILLVIASALATIASRHKGLGGGRPSSLLIATGILAAVFLASLTFSILLTTFAQSAAYFNTFTRAWEFAAGALVACAFAWRPSLGIRGATQRPQIATIATIAGLALIAVAAFLFDEESAFPGAIAMVPVVGAVLVIIFGGSLADTSVVSRIALWAPAQRMGDWSYAIYLWHWPLIALFPFAFVGVKLDSWKSVVVIVVSVALGAATKYLIEDPVRKGRWWKGNRWPSFALAASGAALILVFTSVQSGAIETKKVEAQSWSAEQLASDAPCFGARAMTADAPCSSPYVITALTDVVFAATDLDAEWCLAEPHEDWRSCQYGEPEFPGRTIALVGDSHAAALVPALEASFAKKGWKLVTYLRTGCPGLSTAPIDLPGRELWEQDACAEWSSRVLDEIEVNEELDEVIFTNFSSRYASEEVPEAGRLTFETVTETWNRLQGAGKTITVIRDIPDTNRVNIPTCLATSYVRNAPCAFDRQVALVDDVVQAAVRDSTGVRLVDMSDYFCDDTRCYAVIGDVVVYADENHVSETYALTLAPYLGREFTDDVG